MRQLRVDEATCAALAYQVGSGEVVQDGTSTRLRLGENDGQAYGDAQLDDYHGEGGMVWRPPVRMTLRARFSRPQTRLRGTAGFGFWNDPFGMTKGAKGRRWLPAVRLPQAVWFFFAAPPSDMALAMGVAGHGWKGATIDAGNWVAKALLPAAPIGMLACRVSWGYRRFWPLAQGVLKIDEAMVATTMDEWHDYRLEWLPEEVRMEVDGAVVLRTRRAPRGPLGFVAWIDNQYMIATPQGRVASGTVAHEEQALEIESLVVTTL